MTEYLLIAFAGTLSLCVYMIYTYFDQRLERTLCYMREAIEDMDNRSRQRINILEHKIKDGLQSNSTCTKSYQAKIHKEIEEYHDKCTERFSMVIKRIQVLENPHKTVLEVPKKPIETIKKPRVTHE